MAISTKQIGKQEWLELLEVVPSVTTNKLYAGSSDTIYYDGSELAKKSYVDSVAAGLDPKESVRVATTAAILRTGTPTIDGITLVAGNRVLVKNQAITSENGIYDVVTGGANVTADITGTAMTVSVVNSGTLAIGDYITGTNVVTGTYIVSGSGLNWVVSQAPTSPIDDGTITSTSAWTRSTDSDGTPSNEVSGGNFTFVEQGTVNGGNGFVLVFDGDVVVGTDPQVWTQFSTAEALPSGSATGQVLTWDNGTSSWATSSDIFILEASNTIAVDGTFTLATYTNGDILLAPDGSGNVVISGTDVTTGTNENLTLAPNGTGNVVISGADITTGTDQDLTLAPNGTGNVVVSSADLVLSTASITTLSGSDQNLTLAPDGTGNVVVSNADLMLSTATIITASNESLTLNPNGTGIIEMQANPSYNILTVSGTTTLTQTQLAENHVIIINATGGPAIITLPDSGMQIGQIYTFKMLTNNGANSVTLDPGTTNLIDGSGTDVVTSIDYTSYKLLWAGSGVWYEIL